MDGKLLKQELKEIHLENLEETITIGWYALSQYFELEKIVL